MDPINRTPNTGGKKGRGHSWNLTENRIATIVDMLTAQHTLISIAQFFKINNRTLTIKLKEAGIDAKTIRNVGLVSFKVKAYDDINSIEEAPSRASMRLSYLKQFPIKEEAEQVPVNTETMKQDLYNQIQLIPEADKRMKAMSDFLRMYDVGVVEHSEVVYKSMDDFYIKESKS